MNHWHFCHNKYLHNSKVLLSLSIWVQQSREISDSIWCDVVSLSWKYALLLCVGINEGSTTKRKCRLLFTYSPAKLKNTTSKIKCILLRDGARYMSGRVNRLSAQLSVLCTQPRAPVPPPTTSNGISGRKWMNEWITCIQCKFFCKQHSTNKRNNLVFTPISHWLK